MEGRCQQSMYRGEGEEGERAIESDSAKPGHP